METIISCCRYFDLFSRWKQPALTCKKVSFAANICFGICLQRVHYRFNWRWIYLRVVESFSNHDKKMTNGGLAVSPLSRCQANKARFNTVLPKWLGSARCHLHPNFSVTATSDLKQNRYELLTWLTFNSDLKWWCVNVMDLVTLISPWKKKYAKTCASWNTEC